MRKDIWILARWSKLTGIMELMIGTIIALYGYTFYYIGAIPGLLIVISGIRLLRASRSAKRLNYNLRILQPDTALYDETLQLFASYLKMQSLVLLFFVTLIVVCLATFTRPFAIVGSYLHF